MLTTTGLMHLRELDAEIERAKASLGPEVVRVAYRLREDSTDVASIFFRITLRDWAVAEGVILDISGRVAKSLREQIRPLENWGLVPYFNFRSESSQRERPNPEWV